jgi:uncharacterized damage-inducible protein DinB
LARYSAGSPGLRAQAIRDRQRERLFELARLANAAIDRADLLREGLRGIDVRGGVELIVDEQRECPGMTPPETVAGRSGEIERAGAGPRRLALLRDMLRAPKNFSFREADFEEMHMAMKTKKPAKSAMKAKHSGRNQKPTKAPSSAKTPKSSIKRTSKARIGTAARGTASSKKTTTSKMTTSSAAAVSSLKNVKAFFEKTISVLEERDSDFAPNADMFTAAQHVAHTAQTIDWFIQGAFRPQGFDMDFAKHAREVRQVDSLRQARAWLDRAVKNAMEVIGSKSSEELQAPLPKDGIMGGAPKAAIVSGIEDHTAHHRGSLAVYIRLLGKVPPMPYM